MGLLDDAIREHIDLKRRRGADPSELAREEQEALGPPRRMDDDAGHDATEVLGSSAATGAAVAEPGEELDAAHPDDAPPEPSGAISLDRLADEEVEWHDAPRPASDPPPAVREEQREDVLEETPEFLSETPEHDRLWFEQRPPRDFNME